MVEMAGTVGATIVAATMHEPFKQERPRIGQKWQMFAIDAGCKSAGKTGLRWAPEVGWAGHGRDGLGWASRDGAAIVAATMEEPSKCEWPGIGQDWQMFGGVCVWVGLGGTWEEGEMVSDAAEAATSASTSQNFSRDSWVMLGV